VIRPKKFRRLKVSSPRQAGWHIQTAPLARNAVGRIHGPGQISQDSTPRVIRLALLLSCRKRLRIAESQPRLRGVRTLQAVSVAPGLFEQERLLEVVEPAI
jgi:hypothetical protein